MAHFLEGTRREEMEFKSLKEPTCFPVGPQPCLQWKHCLQSSKEMNTHLGHRQEGNYFL